MPQAPGAGAAAAGAAAGAVAGAAAAGYDQAAYQQQGYQQQGYQQPGQIEQGVSNVAGGVEQGIQQGMNNVANEFNMGSENVSEGALKATIMRGVELVKQNPMQALMCYGPIALIPALVGLLLGWVPVVGPILQGVSGLVGLLGPLAMGALGYYMLKAHLGEPVSGMDAWKAMFKNGVAVWLSFFVASIIAGIGFAFIVIPGIALGCCIGQVFFVEKGRFVALNMRSLEYFKADVGRFIVLFLLAVFAPVVAAGILGFVLALVFGFIPVVGAHLGPGLAGLIAAVGQVVAITVYVATMTGVYFEIRKKLEGRDFEDDARAALAEFDAGLKGEQGMDLGAAGQQMAAQGQQYGQQGYDAAQQAGQYAQQGYDQAQQQGYDQAQQQQQQGYDQQQYQQQQQQGYDQQQQQQQQQPQHPPQQGGYPPQGGQGGQGGGGYPQQ
jgi:hypothetical protein